MQVSAEQLAQLLGGTIEGDPDVTVNRPSKIEEGGAGSISFLGNMKYESYAYSTTASILLIPEDFTPARAVAPTLIRVPDVYASVAILLAHFGEQPTRQAGVSAHASVHQEAQLADTVSVAAHAIVEAGAIVGEGCLIMGQAYVGANARLGANVILHPGAKVLHDCEVGDHCILQAGAIVGSDGFGFAPREDGSYQKIAHVGKVILEQHVEVGANTTIDRATMGATIVRKGVKLDNLVQVGHNVEIGAHTVIAAQAGIAGSTKIGKHCRIGGQVGFVGHITIADGTQVQAQSGIASSIVPPNQAWFGTPAIGYRDFIRSYAVFKKLPELYKQLTQLEKKINNGD